MYFAAELRILLVYLSESLGRLCQNGAGDNGGYIFIGGVGSLAPRRTAPALGNTLQLIFTQSQNIMAVVVYVDLLRNAMHHL